MGEPLLPGASTGPLDLRGVRAVLFDLDGVLVDSYRVWLHLMNGVAARLGYPAISEETFHGCWGQGLRADCEQFYTRHSEAEIAAEFETEYPRHLEHLAIFPDAPRVLAALHERSIGTAVVTNSTAAIARLVLARGGLDPQELVGGDDVPHAKPAPDMVLRACELLGVAVGEAVMVGDSRYDKEAAAAAGVRFVGMGIGGDVEIEGLGELVG